MRLLTRLSMSLVAPVDRGQHVASFSLGKHELSHGKIHGFLLLGKILKIKLAHSVTTALGKQLLTPWSQCVSPVNTVKQVHMT